MEARHLHQHGHLLRTQLCVEGLASRGGRRRVRQQAVVHDERAGAVAAPGTATGRSPRHWRRVCERTRASRLELLEKGLVPRLLSEPCLLCALCLALLRSCFLLLLQRRGRMFGALFVRMTQASWKRLSRKHVNCLAMFAGSTTLARARCVRFQPTKTQPDWPGSK